MFTDSQFNFAPGEETRLVIHKHWFIFFLEIMGIAIVFLLPFFFVPFVGQSIMQNGASIEIPAALTLFLSALWTLVVWCKAFGMWTDYYLDIWIVTNRRIIDVEQKGFFHRDIATILELGKIEDVKTVQHGFFATMLDFGDIQVQTAGARDEFIMEGMANPRYIEHVIRGAMQESILHTNTLGRFPDITQTH